MKVLPFYAVCGIVALASVVVYPRSGSQASVCDFQPVSNFNPKLPASHVQNQCARDRDGVAEVSWLSWVAGKSPSFQFHFLDLLELLHDDEGQRDLSKSSKDPK